ncbi:carboxypeptidase regulatory-like domain-containing protein [Jatrophihabitans sp.]|uniref:carboxypeptidase regulatory-like domain-containing protein n=1 Tax=Jatrophihabitans sp. TaxID=1932789 RepID=UPI002BBAB776|nr:carboxypeptidase regulatory-like domain-containing protein [Jatrophihabitans sp.]
MAGNDVRSISLTWTNPTDPDFAGVLIRRAASDTPPVTASEGTLVAALDGRKTAFTDKHLTGTSTYSYAVFPRDKSRNVGVAATLTTATRSTSTATGLRGQLTDQQGHPIVQAAVEIRVAGSGDYVAGTATATNGQFSVTGLASGSYLLCFHANNETTGHSVTGYLPGCYRQQPYGYGNIGTPVTVRAGKMTSGLVDYLLVAGAISGRVTDSANRAISDVSVSVYDLDDPSQYSSGAVTRSDGSYTVTGLPAGSYQVCFSSQGATGASTTGYLDECYDDQPPYNSGTPVPVTLGHTSSGIDAALATGGAITGHITDTSGVLLPAISASAFSADYGSYGFSDSTGAYALTGLPTGNYTLCFDGSYTVSDAAPYGYTNSCAGDHWLNVDVEAGQATTVNGTVEKAGGVGGTVTGDSGPVPGVWVSVFDSSGNQLNSTNTDESGRYLFNGVAPGDVTVCFDPTYTAGGYRRTCYGAQADGTGSPIAVTAGQLSTADVQLSKGASITGTITDASGAPISGVLVSAYSWNTWEGYFSQTDESGNYTLSGLAADDYRVCFDPSYAQGPAAGGYAMQCYDNQPSMDTADPVTVGAAGSVTVNAVLRAGAAITGRITGSDGAALGGVYIYAFDPESGQYATGASSDYSDGSYRLPGLAPGDYAVCFDAVNVRQPAPTGYVNECYDNNSYALVHVTGGTVTTGIDAELAVGAGISGRVTDSAGHGLPSISVEVYRVDGSYLASGGFTDDTGRYQLTGLPATAAVLCFDSYAGPNDTGYPYECYDNKPDMNTANPVDTTAGQMRTGIDAQLADGAGISGQITDTAGNGIPYAFAEATGVDGSYLGSDQADDTGHYQINRLPAAAVVVCFQAGYLHECYDNKPDRSTANPVDTTAGEVQTGIDAELTDPPPA